MLLTLKVLSCRGLPPAEPKSICFDQGKGTIGRASDNDLVLPDPENFISRHHAEIKYEGGRYILFDTSLSGTVIDGGEPLKKSSAELREGMRIYIGDYELGVHLQESAQDEASLDGIPESELLTDIVTPVGYPYTENRPGADALSDPDEAPRFDFTGDSDDPFADLLDLQPKAPDPLAPLEKKPSLQDNFEPPNAHLEEAESPAVPDDFDFEELFGTSFPIEPEVEEKSQPAAPKPAGDDGPPAESFDFGLPEPEFDSDAKPSGHEIFPESWQVVQHPERPARAEAPQTEVTPRKKPDERPSRVSASQEGNRQAIPMFKVLMEAIGIDETDFPRGVSEEATVRLIGLMFRDLVEGMMILLRSRAELKSQVRVSVTTIRPFENNPLKFTVTVEDALNTLLKPRQRGYLKPLDAIQNAFGDLSNHQLAMTAGIQASLIDVLKKFDPERFGSQIQSGLFKNKDAKCWEAYAKAYEQLVSEGIDNFFGTTFVNAYEKQIRALESKHGKK